MKVGDLGYVVIGGAIRHVLYGELGSDGYGGEAYRYYSPCGRYHIATIDEPMCETFNECYDKAIRHLTSKVKA